MDNSMDQSTVIFRKTGYTFKCEVNGVEAETGSVTFTKVEFTSTEKLTKENAFQTFLYNFKTKFKEINFLKITEMIHYESTTDEAPFDKEGETYEFHEIDLENSLK